MRIYFYDENHRCIGSRLLKDGEEMPQNCTTLPVVLVDGKEAFLVDGQWVVSDIPPRPEPPEQSL